MSHVCAKPACTQVVKVWLDFLPTSHQVVEQRSRSEVSVGLCETHERRFTVPAGWSFERLPSSETVDGDVDAVPTVETAATSTEAANLVHSRERPWFLALSDVVLDENVFAEASESEALEPTEPSEGSLLHRAFHGPDRSTDELRAARAHVDELEPRRAARAPKVAKGDGVKDNGMTELPFPPFEPEHRIAVS